MPKKLKFLIFFFVMAFLLLTAGHTVFALELAYPPIGGINLNTDPTLENFIAYFFYLAVAIAGLLGVLSIVIAGVILLASAGSPGAAGAARERIFGSILGIVLLMFSVILLSTINPALITPKTQQLAPTILSGPVLTNGKEYLPAENQDNLWNIPAGFYTLKNNCVPGSEPDIFVWKYKVENQDDNDPGATVVAVPCGQSTDIANWASYAWAYKEPGVYLFKGPNCLQGGSNSTEVITDTGNIPLEFQRKVTSALIVNGEGDNEPRYGFVLNENPNLLGTCSKPYNNFDSGDFCLDVSIEGDCGEVTIPPPPPPPPSGSRCLDDQCVDNCTDNYNGCGQSCATDIDCSPPPSGNRCLGDQCVENCTDFYNGCGASCATDINCSTPSVNVCRLGGSLGTGGGGGTGGGWQCVPDDGRGGPPCPNGVIDCETPKTYCTSAEPFQCISGGSSGLSCADNPDCAGHCESSGGSAQCVFGEASNGQSSCFVSEDCDVPAKSFCKPTISGELCKGPACPPRATTYSCVPDGDPSMPCPTTGAADCGKTYCTTGSEPKCDATGNGKECTSPSECTPSRCAVNGLNGQPYCSNVNTDGGLCDKPEDCTKPHCTEGADSKCVMGGKGKVCSGDPECGGVSKCVTGASEPTCSPTGDGAPCTAANIETTCGKLGTVCFGQQCIAGGDPKKYCDPKVCEGGQGSRCDETTHKCVVTGNLNDTCPKTCEGGPGTRCSASGQCVLTDDLTQPPCDPTRCVPSGFSCRRNSVSGNLYCAEGPDNGGAACDPAGQADQCGYTCTADKQCVYGNTGGGSCNPYDTNLATDQNGGCDNPTHTVCDYINKQCVPVAGGGNNECTPPANNPGGPRVLSKIGDFVEICKDACAFAGGTMNVFGTCVGIPPIPIINRPGALNDTIVPPHPIFLASLIGTAFSEFKGIKLSQYDTDDCDNQCGPNEECRNTEGTPNIYTCVSNGGSGGGTLDSGITGSGSCTLFGSTSIYIIKGLNPGSEQFNNSSYAGDGISFYENGDEDGTIQRLDTNITGPRYVDLTRNGDSGTPGIGQYFTYESPDKLLIDYGKLQRVPNYVKDTCMIKDSGGKDSYYYPCTSGIVPRGNFLMIIYKQNENRKNDTCAFYTEEIEDFVTELDNNEKVSEMHIFPTTP